ncbi:hypothetical protein ACSMX9_22745 [Streptomyces sp. LE64]|uniref:hypothetical protein n=1 Tax=Streptomyces sp. LE64 TaxID=3448653 RepID=UPI004043113B
MIPPVQLTHGDDAVRIPHGRAVDETLDALAIAYAENPGIVGALLSAHAGTVLCLDMAVVCPTTPDHIRAMRAAEADGTRDALAALAPPVGGVDDIVTADEAVTLATRLMRLAALIRHKTTP